MSFNNYKIYVITLLCVNTVYTMQKDTDSRIKPSLENNVLLWDKLAFEELDLVFSKKNSLAVFEYCCNNNIPIKGINECNAHLLQGILESPKPMGHLEQLCIKTDFDTNSMVALSTEHEQKCSNFHQVLFHLSRQNIKIDCAPIIKFFLSKKADINKKNFYENTSFHYIAKVLQESDKNDFSGIVISENEPVLCTHDYNGLIKSLCTFKGDPNIKNHYNETPFCCAMIQSGRWPNPNFEKNIGVWLDHKANPNSRLTTVNTSTMKILLTRTFDMNRLLACFLSKRDVLTLETLDKVLKTIEKRANNQVRTEDQLKNIIDMNFFDKYDLNTLYYCVNKRYNNITLQNIKSFKKYIIRANDKNNLLAKKLSHILYSNNNNDLIKDLAENSLNNYSNNLLERLFNLQQKCVIECISQSIESCDSDTLQKVLKYNGKLIDERLPEGGFINKVIRRYWFLEKTKQHSERNQSEWEAKQQQLQKITSQLLQYNAKPYLFCDDNEFPYEAILFKYPSEHQIKMSNLLLDGVVNYFSTKPTTKCWLLCMKRLQWKMPSPIKKIICNMNNFDDVVDLENQVDMAKEGKWYNDGLKRNNLHNVIKNMLDKWRIDNPEKSSYFQAK